MKQVLNTTTRITRIGTNIDIFTFYESGDESIMFFISDAYGDIYGVGFKENELGYTKKGYEDVRFFVNNEGELVVLANDPELFYIDELGCLRMIEGLEDNNYIVTEEGDLMVEEDNVENILIEE